ncbi:MAG: lysophospholipid acyltransferase family protein [Candidatus Neomarinimicrobiota bacterium]|uniref:Phospholipid/glycerol acyltransferase domain-containing protein n=1 Tax=marine metagenome TaxID=408172 RepID=A0A381NMF2_9ZZZZ|nr:lysophospholipid acyltransferase family protein [Candidatus Neomarinimicrobiota bacterium]MEE3139116.1 lysophospholipid acyltransferase family protein [Candidatus Neomarinimicrobiota bacterium]
MRKIWISINIFFWTLFFGIGSIISIKLSNNKNNFKYYGIKWSEVLIKASGVQLEIIGEHNIKDNKNYIFAPNHSSFMDFPVLFVAINKYLVFVAKKELKKIPIFKSILNVSGFIFVDRDNTSDAIDSLNELKSDIKNTPRSVVVFPEGTRSSSNQLQSFKKGAAVLSINTGLPIIPVYIMGSFDWWDTKNFRKNSNKIVVNFGKPIITENKQYEDRENITNSIKKEIIKLQNNEI